MRITDGIIYLARPVLGRHLLSGAATIGTTWLEYTFTQDAEDTGDVQDVREAGPLTERDDCATPRAGWRLLIPMSNVTAVLLGPEEAEDHPRPDRT